METDDINKKTGRDLKSIIFLILIVIFILLLIFTIITLLKNKELILQDPIKYGMKAHGFTSCSCFDSKGLYSYISSTNKNDGDEGWGNLKS